MDEFGRPAEPLAEEDIPNSEHRPLQPMTSTPHDETRLPVRQPQSPSPVPFSHYVPTDPKPHIRAANDLEAQTMSQQNQRPQQQVDEDKDSGGCCKCVIM